MNKTLLSIIIITYNRNELLLQLIAYLDSYDLPFEIHILDSGTIKSEYVIELQKYLDKQRVSYTKFPSDISVAKKISIGSQNINSPYCVLCADDDFLIPPAIFECAKFLEENKDYVAASGRTIGYWKKKDGNIIWKSIYSGSRSNNVINVEERFYNHLSHYNMPTFYSVHRSDIFKMIWNESSECTNDPRFQELLPSMITSIYGKIKIIDYYFYVREIATTSESKNVKTITDFIYDGSYKSKYDSFKKRIVFHLSSFGEISEQHSNKLVDRAMKNYLGGHPVYKKSYLRIKMAASALGLVLLIRKIKLFITNKKCNSKNNPLILSISPCDKYYNDFIKIKNIVERKRKIISIN